jgi:hypothetical protein
VITVVIAAVAITLPQRALAGELPVSPTALAQAGLAAAQNAVNAAAASVSAAQPAIATRPAVAVPAVTGVVPAATPAASPRAAAAPAAAPARTASRPAAVTEHAAARVPRPSVSHTVPARAAGTPLPVAESAARAGTGAGQMASVAPVRVPAVQIPVISVPAVSVPAVPDIQTPAVSVPLISVPVVSVPVVSVPVVSVPLVSVPPVASLPATQPPVVSTFLPADWPSVFTSSTATPGAPASALGALAATGWPLNTSGTSLSGVLPAPLGSTVAGAVFVPGTGFWTHRHAGSEPGHARRTRVHAAVATSAAGRGLRPVRSGSWSAPATRPPLSAHVSVPSVPRLRNDGAMSPRPARPARESSAPVLPLTAPVTGSGAAAGASGSSGGGAAAMLTAATLFLIFLLSTRVSLDMSAWRSTLLSLRLERPG